MKRFIKIAVILAVLGALLIPGMAKAAELESIEKVAVEEQPTDSEVLKAITAVGADKEYVELSKDYGLVVDGKHPYSRTWKDLKSDYHFLEISQLPMVDAQGIKLNPGWAYSEGSYYNCSADNTYNNLFWAEVAGTQVTLIVKNDEPNGVKQGDQVVYDPQLFLDGKEITPKSIYAGRYAVDPYNENYRYNVLEWDYEICKRQIRIVEGMYRERWVFDKDPGGEVRITHNQEGNYPLQLGQYAIDADTELVPREAFIDPMFGYPVRVAASATFYSTSSDGYVQNTHAVYATCQSAGTGDSTGAGFDYTVVKNIWYDPNFVVARVLLYFDTSGLGAGAIVTACTLGIYGDATEGQDEETAGHSDLLLYEGTQAAPFTTADFDSFNATALSDSFANWEYPLATDAYNTITLNAAGRGVIVVDGTTKLCIRCWGDQQAAEPTGVGNIYNYVYIWANEKGSGYQPKLVVTYTPAAPDPPTNVSATDGDHTDKVVITWTKSDGATKYEVFRGAVGLGELGDVATYDDSGATAGTITNSGTVTASDGTQTAHIVLSLASEATSVGATHSYTVKAGNVDGWSGASGANNGNRGVGAITYQWQRSAGDADGGYGNIGGATTDPYNDTAAPEGTISNAGTVTATSGVHTDKVVLSLAGEATANGAGRYYQCIVSSTGASNSPQTSDNNRGYRGVGSITYQWQVNDGGGYDNIGGATTDPYNYTDAPAGTISNAGTVTATSGVHTDKVVLSLAGEATTDGATYDYQCIVSAVDASNSPQTSDNNDGYRGAGAITYQWQVDDGEGYDNIGGGTTDPYDYSSAPAGTITPGNAGATSGVHSDKVVLSLAGESVADGATYDYQCIVSSVDASNSPQTSDNDTGYRTTGAITFQWQVNDGGGYDNIGGATTENYDYAGAPSPTITAGNAVATDGDHTDKVSLSLAGTSSDNGATYDYQCVLDATGCAQQTSASDTGYTGAGALSYQWEADRNGGYGDIGGATGSTYNDTGSPAPSITAGNAVATDGDHTDKVSLSLAGTSSDDGATNNYRCKLTAPDAAGQTCGANTGYRGGGALSYQWEVDRGVGWGDIGGATGATYNDTVAPAGSISNAGTASASDGTEAAHVVLSLAGEATTDGATNEYRCKLTAPDAAGQTSASNTGYRTVGAITFQWQRSSADADADYSNIGGGTTDPYNDTGAPADGSGRYFQCVISSVDASNTPQTSTNDRGYRYVVLSITTLSCTGFDKYWAIVNGSIDAGSNPVTQTGFEYGLSTSYGDNQTTVGVWGVDDEFWEKLLSLTPATVYHYRAMAYDGTWAYGGDRVFSTEGSPTLYEYLNTGGDGDSGAIYSANWTAEQFTSGNVTHTVTSVRVPLKRVGTYPGTVELALTYADSDNFSTGADLTIAYLNGNAMSSIEYVWYDFDVPDITLSDNTSHTVVVRATAGNSTDYILWQKDSGGALANAVGSHSMDSGISWITDAPVDYLFEIWGEVVLSMERAAVFSGYVETGDWLIVMTYHNTYAPYYPNDDPEAYFYLQLVDDTTVKAQVTCPAWGYRPGSIYISNALANTLEWGAAYKIRLYGDFGANPSTEYVLTALDWRGAELSFLDSWVIAQANSIGDHYDTTLTVDIADLGEVLNAAGHTIFSIGITDLNVVRPGLFEMVVMTPEYEAEDHTQAMDAATDLETRIGSTIYDLLEDGGDIVNTDAEGFGGFMLFIFAMVIVVVASSLGNFPVGVGLGFMPLLGGAWIGLIDWVLMGVIAFIVGGFIFVYYTWLTK